VKDCLSAIPNSSIWVTLLTKTTRCLIWPAFHHLPNCPGPAPGAQGIHAADSPGQWLGGGVGRGARQRGRLFVARRRRGQVQSARETRTAVSLHLPYTGVGKAPVPHPARRHRLLAEDPVPRRHHARDLRAAGFHRSVGSARSPAAPESDPLPWGICAQQPLPRPDHACRARARRQARQAGARKGSHAG